jgi:2'-5' RNA ligase
LNREYACSTYGGVWKIVFKTNNGEVEEGVEGLFRGPFNRVGVRCFIAISCPAEVRLRLAEVGRQLACCGEMRLVEVGNIHMTLKFLGEVQEQKAMEIAENLAFLEGEVRFGVTVKGLGVFPNADRINVIWAGVERPEGIAGLQRRLDDSLSDMGFQREQRFHPHYTIARVKRLTDRKNLMAFVKAGEGREFGSYAVESAVLMSSELGRDGPAYAAVREYRLS